MIKYAVAALAAVFLLTGAPPALVSLQGDLGPAAFFLPAVQAEEPASVVFTTLAFVPDWANREVVAGDLETIEGRVYWSDGKPAAGALVVWLLHYPLAPDGLTARETDTVAFAATDWRGYVQLRYRVPWGLVWPGEERVQADGELHIIAIDEASAQGAGPFVVGSHISRYPVFVSGGVPAGAD